MFDCLPWSSWLSTIDLILSVLLLKLTTIHEYDGSSILLRSFGDTVYVMTYEPFYSFSSFVQSSLQLFVLTEKLFVKTAADMHT